MTTLTEDELVAAIHAELERPKNWWTMTDEQIIAVVGEFVEETSSLLTGRKLLAHFECLRALAEEKPAEAAELGRRSLTAVEILCRKP